MTNLETRFPPGIYAEIEKRQDRQWDLLRGWRGLLPWRLWRVWRDVRYIEEMIVRYSGQ